MPGKSPINISIAKTKRPRHGQDPNLTRVFRCSRPCSARGCCWLFSRCLASITTVSSYARGENIDPPIGPELSPPGEALAQELGPQGRGRGVNAIYITQHAIQRRNNSKPLADRRGLPPVLVDSKKTQSLSGRFLTHRPSRETSFWRGHTTPRRRSSKALGLGMFP